jgi:hypothetical protein
MNDILNNSFFYFFSATPQVLAAILALFGFFLIFKIQALKGELIVKAMDILEYVRSMDKLDRGENEAVSENINKIFHSLTQSIRYKNVGILFKIICKDGKNLALNDLTYKTYSNQVNSTFKLQKSIIESTIFFSILTILTIIACMTILAFGDFFLSKPDHLKDLYGFMLLLIAGCFTGLVAVLYLSLNNQSSLDLPEESL